MISINGVRVSTITRNGKKVTSMYRNGKLIFQSVRSCFGSGIWVGNKPWIGAEVWK